MHLVTFISRIYHAMCSVTGVTVKQDKITEVSVSLTCVSKCVYWCHYFV